MTTLKSSIQIALDAEVKRVAESAKALRDIKDSISMPYRFTLPISEKEVDDILTKKEFGQRGVYIFSLSEPSDFIRVKNGLDLYRESSRRIEKGKKLAVVRSNISKSKYLYVGKIHSSTFRSRLKQHLIGSQSSGTYSMRLSKWINRLNLNSEYLKLRIIPLPKEHKDEIRLL